MAGELCWRDAVWVDILMIGWLMWLRCRSSVYWAVGKRGFQKIRAERWSLTWRDCDCDCSVLTQESIACRLCMQLPAHGTAFHCLAGNTLSLVKLNRDSFTVVTPECNTLDEYRLMHSFNVHYSEWHFSYCCFFFTRILESKFSST